MSLINAALGAIVLLFGRPLYWLFVGIAGFLIGMELATHFLTGQPEWVTILAAVAAGVVGALLAVIAQRLAFGLAGFLSLGYLTSAVAHTAAQVSPEVALGFFIVGGIVGAILAVLLMDWAIIVLSSLIGASMIVAAFNLTGVAALVVYVVLAAIGIAVQSQIFQGRYRRPATAAPRHG